MKNMYDRVGFGGEGVDDMQIATQFYLMGGRSCSNERIDVRSMLPSVIGCRV